MRAVAALALMGGFFLAAGIDAFAEKRVALVIGNARFVNASKLINPPNDVAAASVMLETAGFSVV